MKKEIIAYITALTDVYSHTVNMPMKAALDNLIEFVIDIPDNKEQSIKTFNIALENEDLKKCNAELLNKLNQLGENNKYLEDINERVSVENKKLIYDVENLRIVSIF